MILFVGIQWPRGQCADITLTFMNLAEAFIQSDLQSISGCTIFFISLCVPWELNPQSFALLTQCSTTEPQEHMWHRYALGVPSSSPSLRTFPNPVHFHFAYSLKYGPVVKRQ